MAQGISRNLAANLADRTVAAGKSYEEGYYPCTAAVGVVKSLDLTALGEAFAEIATTASRAAAAIGAAMSAFAEAYHKAPACLPQTRSPHSLQQTRPAPHRKFDKNTATAPIARCGSLFMFCFTPPLRR